MIQERNNSLLYKIVVSLVVLFCIVPLLVSAQSSDAPEGYIYEWRTDIEEAVEESGAVEESEAEKYVFVYFAGSDWCPHCMRFEKEVINTPTFRRYLEQNFVPVLIDSPRYYSLSEEQKAYNQASSQKYQVGGYPTMVILDPEGKLVTTTGYNREGANGFIKNLKKAIR